METKQEVHDDIEQDARSGPSLTTTESSERESKKMSVGDEREEKGGRNCASSRCGSLSKRPWNLIRNQLHILLVSFLVFAVLLVAGVLLCRLYTESDEEDRRDEAMDFARETGA